jgi:hypothetical protein
VLPVFERRFDPGAFGILVLRFHPVRRSTAAPASHKPAV